MAGAVPFGMTCGTAGLIGYTPCDDSSADFRRHMLVGLRSLSTAASVKSGLGDERSFADIGALGDWAHVEHVVERSAKNLIKGSPVCRDHADVEAIGIALEAAASESRTQIALPQRSAEPRSSVPWIWAPRPARQPAGLTTWLPLARCV